MLSSFTDFYANTQGYEKSDNLKKMLADFQAEQESAAKTQESLKTRLKGLKEEYANLRSAEEKAEKRENTLAIMGAVFGFLGQAASIASDVSDKGNVGAEKGDTANAKEIKASQKKKEELEGKTQALKDEIAVLQKSLEQKVKEKDAAKEEEKETLNKEIGQTRESICTKKVELEAMEKEEKATKGTFNKLSKVFEGAAKTTEQAGGGSSVAQTRNERMNLIYEEMIRLEEENTKQLGLLAKYTKQMETTVIDQNATEAAVQALIIAISCLKRVVVAVMDIALFWNSMEACCKSLAESSLKDTIQDLQSIDKAERIAYYYSEEFLKAAGATREHLNKTVVTADPKGMSRETHWNMASALAGEVGGQIQEQILESGAKAKALEAKKTA